MIRFCLHVSKYALSEFGDIGPVALMQHRRNTFRSHFAAWHHAHACWTRWSGVRHATALRIIFARRCRSEGGPSSLPRAYGEFKRSRRTPPPLARAGVSGVLAPGCLAFTGALRHVRPPEDLGPKRGRGLRLRIASPAGMILRELSLNAAADGGHIERRISFACPSDNRRTQTHFYRRTLIDLVASTRSPLLFSSWMPATFNAVSCGR